MSSFKKMERIRSFTDCVCIPRIIPISRLERPTETKRITSTSLGVNLNIPQLLGQRVSLCSCPENGQKHNDARCITSSQNHTYNPMFHGRTSVIVSYLLVRFS